MKLLRAEKKACLCLGCLAALAALLISCTQDPIFAMIAREVEPREPWIKGVPSRMVVFDYDAGNYSMFVGASSLHRYKNGVWDQDLPQPPGMIADLAATKSYLYAMVNPDSPRLYRLGKGAGSWEHVPFNNSNFPRLQAVYGTCESDGKPNSDYLFAGSSKRDFNVSDKNDYAVFYINGDGGFQEIITGTAFLTGAAYDGMANYYFSTNGQGVYHSDAIGTTPFSPVSNTENKGVSGMILINASLIAALCHDGDVLKVASSNVTLLGNAGGYDFTGPLAVWNTDRLLLAAVKTTSTTYGYREIPLYKGPLSSSGSEPFTIQMPGTVSGADSSTMDDSKHYQDAVEPKPVNAIFQVPDYVDSARPLFASIQGRGTAKDNTDGGLWSYRQRDGGWQWNAE